MMLAVAAVVVDVVEVADREKGLTADVVEVVSDGAHAWLLPLVAVLPSLRKSVVAQLKTKKDLEITAETFLRFSPEVAVVTGEVIVADAAATAVFSDAVAVVAVVEEALELSPLAAVGLDCVKVLLPSNLNRLLEAAKAER